jgi:hypothetical protein
MEIIDLHLGIFKHFDSIKSSTKKVEKAERSLKVTLAFLHIMIDFETVPDDGVVNLYETLHRSLIKDLHSSQGLKWMIMILESFHLNECCIPYHSGETHEQILLIASKYILNEGFPQEAFISSIEHVFYINNDIGVGFSFFF